MYRCGEGAEGMGGGGREGGGEGASKILEKTDIK